MNRQLLPRRAEIRATSRVPQRNTAAPAQERAKEVIAARPRVLRRPAVLALVTAGAAGSALLAWVLLTGSGDTTADQPSPFARAGAAPTATAPTASARAGSTVAAGRDPFAADGLAARGQAPGTGGPGLGAPPNDAPTSPPHTEAVVPAPAPASPTTSPTGAPAPGGGSASPTVTVTVTTAASYLGLYGWNGDRAAFRLNTTPFHLTVGSSWSTGLRFIGTVKKGTLTCAVVSNPATQQTSLTVCPGQVVRLG